MAAHLSTTKLRAIRDLLIEGRMTPPQIAIQVGVSDSAVYYQRRLLGIDGARPVTDVRPRKKGGPRHGSDSFIAPRPCFVGGCEGAATEGNFCAAHSAPAMAARATSGLSEQTRRKLTRGRA
jgi:hypothetical protein